MDVREPKAGDTLSAKWLRQLLDITRTNQVRPGGRLVGSQTPSGLALGLLNDPSAFIRITTEKSPGVYNAKILNPRPRGGWDDVRTIVAKEVNSQSGLGGRGLIVWAQYTQASDDFRFQIANCPACYDSTWPDCSGTPIPAVLQATFSGSGTPVVLTGKIIDTTHDFPLSASITADCISGTWTVVGVGTYLFSVTLSNATKKLTVCVRTVNIGVNRLVKEPISGSGCSAFATECSTTDPTSTTCSPFRLVYPITGTVSTLTGFTSCTINVPPY